MLGMMILLGSLTRLRAEAMLQLFNVNWDELIQKMPELAEAGYTSLWLPPPAKAGSVFSVGYDLFDPFDLGDKNQRGTVRTRYGTKAELLQVVEIAHRFGIRVYFDNIMNHRGFDIPGYNSSTPTNLYPGLSVKDFHLRQQNDGTYRNWDNVSDWSNVWQVQHRPLFGLIDLANENGSVNENFGATEGNTTAKISFLRHPNNREYYMDTNLPVIVAPWRPFNGTNGDPVIEDVNAYLIRAAVWTLAETKCDGFRFDAVKHVPSNFFGDTLATANGYVGAIQTMFDYVHGYGNNVTGNGYVEGDDNRNSSFDSETPRNDALLFGEHLGEPPSYQEYLDRGMRLVNSPYHFQLNNILGNPSASLVGLDQRDYKPYGTAFPGQYSILFAQSHDDGSAERRELQNGYNFFREGIPCIYSDGYNQSSAPDYFPRVANAPYLGEFGDNKMPDVAYLHHQLARGGTRARWSDADIVAFERYDYREAGSDADQTVVLFVMNDNYGNPGDTSFDDDVAQSDVGMPSTCYPVQNSRHQGLVVSFPPGSWLSQLADSPGKDRACPKILVRQATASQAEAEATKNDANPINRKVYVGAQTIPAGGGAVEFKIPSGSYVAYAYQWPEPSRVNLKTNAITIRQGGADVPRIKVVRRDGVNGDAGFNPLYPFKMRGSVDQYGNVLTGINLSNKTYAIDVPIVTNGLMDILVRCDASAVNTLLKLDGGADLNSQMGLGFNGGVEKRDNRPGSVSDVYLGYEQTAFQFRFGPEKFGAAATNRNNTVSSGAETYHYTVGGATQIINGAGYRSDITNATAAWVYHNPAAANTAIGGPATQRVPVNPTNGGPTDIWIRSGYQFQVNRCFIYYTVDGSNPEGAFGVGKGTTKVVEALFIAHDTGSGVIDWWKGTIPKDDNLTGNQIRYKVSAFKDNISEIIDFEDAKFFGLNLAAVTNFDPTAVTVWLHNDRNTNNTATGLREGFHILRARAFLPRTNKSSVYNTFLQTFYYDSSLPTGTVASPATNNAAISNTTYQVVIRADSTVTGVEFNISDGDANNDDANTGQNNGNGLTNGVPKFVAASAVSPNAGLTTLYPNFPVEYRFTYTAVPTNGSATITVRLKEASTAALPDRLTTLTRIVNTLAPAQTLQIVSPPNDGDTYVVNTNESLTLQACFSQTLTTGNIDLFSIYINGVFQPRRAGDGTPLYVISPLGCGAGLRQLLYDWPSPPVGSNYIQVVFTNTLVLADSRWLTIKRPTDYVTDSDGDGMPDWQEVIAGTDPNDPNSVLRITELANGNQLVVWSSVSNINYQVLATTNLNYPMVPISPVIPAFGSSAFFFDSSTNAGSKYYRIQVIP